MRSCSGPVGQVGQSNLKPSWRLLLPLVAFSILSACPPNNDPPAPPPPNPDVVPQITQQPANQSITEPAVATFTAVATGTPTPTWQWQLSTDGVTFNSIAGATAASYTTAATTVANSGNRYRAVATNRAGSATSNAAVLTVSPAPVAPTITSQPVAQSVSEPATATFTVTATGVPAVSYQWQLSTDGVTYNNLAGASSSSYTTPATTVANSGYRYRVVVTNSAGSITSNAVLLTVIAPTAWSTPAVLGGENASQPAIAASPDGYTLISWIQYDAADQQYNAYARFFDTRTNVWGNDRLIEDLTTNPQATGYTAKGAYAPRVTLGENGRGAVVFGYALPPNSYGVRMVRHTISPIAAAPGMETWSDVETLNSSGENVTSHAVSYFTTASDQYFMGAFSQYDPDGSGIGGPKYRVFAQAFHMPCKGAPACTGLPSLLSPATPDVLPGGSGNVALTRIGNDGLAVWSQSYPGSRAIWSSRFVGSTASWSAAQRINANSTNTAYPSSVASNAAGEAIAVWLELAGSQMEVYGSRWNSNGWSAAVRLDTAVAPASAVSLDSDSPSVSVAIDASGNAMIAWTQRDTSNGFTNVYARTCAAALTACAAPVALKSSLYHASSARVASAPNGDFWAVWKQDNAALEPNAYASRYSSSTGQWSARQRLGGVYLGNGDGPEIAIDGQGRATVVWADRNDNRVYFTRYE